MATEPHSLGLFTQSGQKTHTKCQHAPLASCFHHHLIALMAIITVTVFTIVVDLNSMGSEVQCGLMHTDATKKHFLSCLPCILSFSFIGLKPAEV